MKPSTERAYVKAAYDMESRTDQSHNRSDFVASEGAFGRAWLKFNPGQELIYVNDAEGNPRPLTPKQYAVLTAVVDVINAGTFTTMRAIAGELGYATSTVSRALTKLAAWGIIGYISSRGRYAMTYLFRRTNGDGFDRIRRAAKARLRAYYQRINERISRLAFNVAPTLSLKEGRVVSVSGTRDVDVTDIVATLNGWTPEELREAGIL